MQILTVTVLPQSSRNTVLQTGPTAYKVHVTQPAFKGKANKSMLKELANHLKVPTSKLVISQGDRSNEKTVILLEE